MEILNNINIFLFSKNEQFLKLLGIPAGIIESLILMIFFTTILNINSSLKQKILYVCIMELCGIPIILLFPQPYNIFLNYIIAFFIFLFVFKQSFIKTALGLIFSLIIFALVGFFLLNPYLKILNINYETYNLIPIYKMSYMFLTYSIDFLLIYIIKKLYNFKAILIDEFDNKTKVILISNLLLGILVLCLQTELTFRYINIYSIAFTILNFITLFVYFILSIYSITRTSKLIITTRSLESANEYNDSLQILYDKVSGFHHDLDNMVSAIEGFANDKDFDGLKKYVADFEKECKITNNLALLNPNSIKNPGIFNLLNKKYKKAIKENVDVSLHLLLDLSKLDIKTYDFSRMLGILLDNAIEEASKTDEKKMIIDFHNEPRKHRGVILIKNSYSNKDVNIDKIFERGFSGKKNHSGIGLYEVREFIRKSNNLNLYTSKTYDLFSQQLEIYY